MFAENMNKSLKFMNLQPTVLKETKKKKRGEKEGGHMLKSLKDEAKDCSRIG